MRTWFARLLLAATICDDVCAVLYAKLLINAHYREFEDDDQKEWNALVTADKNGLAKNLLCAARLWRVNGKRWRPTVTEPENNKKI